MKETIACPACEHEFSLTQRDGGKRRSHPQLSRYFKLIKCAHYHWPESAPQFDREEELRKWLQVKAGYGQVVLRMALTEVSKEAAKMMVQATITSLKHYAIPITREEDGVPTLILVEPLSINYGTLAHNKACELFDKVERTITDITGMDAEQLLANPPPKKQKWRDADASSDRGSEYRSELDGGTGQEAA
ncbi:MAG: hypothetical protein ABL901_14490 [Hyphomicrobiaceae bacterium]